jgi:triacylglycerol esterase/lipase EstA (alpha/beta hydrolase family)
MHVRSTVLRILIGVVGSVTVLVASVAGTGLTVANPAGNEHIPYDFFAGVRAELANPGGSYPGSNDFSCRPSKAHPHPVVLVHGTGGNRQTNWATMISALHQQGYCVFALTYGVLPGTTWPLDALGGLTKMESSALELSSFVDRVLAATRTSKVDLVGHSEGTLMPTYYLKYLDGAPKVARYVSLAPYWKGQESTSYLQLETITRALGLDPDRVLPCPECGQEQYGGPFMQLVNSGGSPYVSGIVYTNIMTRYDGIVEPWTDGLVAGPATTNVVLQDTCAVDRSDHLSIVASPRSVAIVLGALDPVHAPPVPCVPVAPVLGI